MSSQNTPRLTRTTASTVSTLTPFVWIPALLAVALAGCGGGEGSTPANQILPAPTSQVLPVQVAPTPPVSSIVTNVPIPSYVASSPELAAFNGFNDARLACGFGKLAQSATLDAAAHAHARWLLTNTPYGHTETLGTPGFTGQFVADRAAFAGYGSRLISEAISGWNGPESFAVGFAATSLLNAPYHLIGLLRGVRDIGLGVAVEVPGVPHPQGYLVVDTGYLPADGPQSATTGTVRTYPCEGTTGAHPVMYGELPSPVPNRDLALSPLGTSIAVVGDVGTVLVVTSVSMVQASTGAVVPMRLPMSRTNDPNSTGIFLRNEAVVSADVPLEPNSRYQVTLAGTSNGIAFTRTFTFTTEAK